MKRTSSMRAIAALGTSALLLAACGGSGGDDPVAAAPPPPAPAPSSDVPAAARTDPSAATAFVRQVVAQPDGNADALRVGDATLAGSESADPEPI